MLSHRKNRTNKGPFLPQKQRYLNGYKNRNSVRRHQPDHSYHELVYYLQSPSQPFV